jgi:16S rRNA (guanine(966)-N(2))-methyltransferase RsmD
MRERCFNVFGATVIDAEVLDLFAGTGAVGIEALSRGAASATFIDSHRSAVALIRANLRSLDVSPDRAHVIQKDSLRAVTELGRSRRRYDLIWADPPFDSWRDGVEALAASLEVGICATDAILCLECPERAAVEAELPSSLEITRDLSGGASRVVLMRSV